MIRSFKCLPGPNYNFEVLVGPYRLKIMINKTVANAYASVYDMKAKQLLVANKTCLHAVNLFAYTKLPYTFFYVHDTGQDPVSVADFPNANFVLNDTAIQ